MSSKADYIMMINNTDKILLIYIHTDPNSTIETSKSAGGKIDAGPTGASAAVHTSISYDIAITQGNHRFFYPTGKSEKVNIHSPYVFITGMVKGADDKYTTFFLNKSVQGGQILNIKSKHLEASWFNPVPFNSIAFLDPSRTVIPASEIIDELDKEIEKLSCDLKTAMNLNLKSADINSKYSKPAPIDPQHVVNGSSNNNSVNTTPTPSSPNTTSAPTSPPSTNTSTTSTTTTLPTSTAPSSSASTTPPSISKHSHKPSKGTSAPITLMNQTGIIGKLTHTGNSFDKLKVSNNSSHKIIYLAIQSDVNSTHVRKASVSTGISAGPTSAGATADVSVEKSRKKVVFSFEAIFNPAHITPPEDPKPSQILIYDKRVNVAVLVKENEKFKMVQSFWTREAGDEIVFTDEELQCPEEIYYSSIKELVSTFNTTNNNSKFKGADSIQEKLDVIEGLNKKIREHHHKLIDE